MQEINIVYLIEKNPISKLSNTYNNKLLNKIIKNFSDYDQQLFVSSFYCYLNYDKNVDFVIDLDNVWKWLGFKQKYNAERLLEKHFKLNVDYTKSGSQVGGAVLNQDNIPKVKQNGGQNIIKIFLTIKCFKSFCLKAQTTKAYEIHEYYMKMEEVLHQTIDEETSELRFQLEEKESIILDQEKQKRQAIEKTIICQFSVNTECVYFGSIDNTNESQEKLIKFGHTNDLETRVLDHHKKYNNFTLIEAFRVQNKVEIENLIKSHTIIKKQIRILEINGKNKTEIIAYDSIFTIDKLSKHIKDIIHSKTYSIDNFNKLMKQNEELLTMNKMLEEENKSKQTEIIQKNIEITDLNLVIENNNRIINSVNRENQSVYQNVLLPEDEMNKKFNEFITSICIVRPDVEELSVNMEGRYRLWNQTKPTKEIFHALKGYLDTRFKPKRVNGHHVYIGVKLKPVEYKKTRENSDVENFIFQVCKFSDTGKILNSVLLTEFQKWKLTIDKKLNDNDMKDLKEYLNSSQYALKATVWTTDGNNEGYYGLSLKQNKYVPKYVSSTGKKVYKKEINTNIILATWESISKAAIIENVSTAKMSRLIKNKNIINDYYYCV